MKLNIQYWLRDYFGFSRRETNGFLVLSVLLLITLSAPLSYPFLYSPNTINTKDQQHLDSLLAILPEPANQPSSFVSKPSENNQQVAQLFPFDPNTVSYEELLSLGFSPKVANNLIKYRSKGAKFYKASQIQGIYEIDEAFFEKISPYLQFPERYASDSKSKSYKKDKYNSEKKEKYPSLSHKDSDNEAPSTPRRTYTSPRIEAFEINQADAHTLRQIKGTGESLSTRIVAYREKLGGFVSLEQLSEVYGLTPEVIEELSKYARLGSIGAVQKLAINQIDANTLAQHPYIDSKKAKTIINYRTQHGKFTNLEELRNIRLLSNEFIEKLAPYLSFE